MDEEGGHGRTLRVWGGGLEKEEEEGADTDGELIASGSNRSCMTDVRRRITKCRIFSDGLGDRYFRFGQSPQLVPTL